MNNNSDIDNSTSIGSTSDAPKTRKRGRPRKEKATVSDTPTASTSTSTPAPASKKRGRPRKIQKVEATDHQKITNIKNFIKKNYPSVASGTENLTTNPPKSMEMAKNLWKKVNILHSTGNEIDERKENIFIICKEWLVFILLETETNLDKPPDLIIETPSATEITDYEEQEGNVFKEADGEIVTRAICVLYMNRKQSPLRNSITSNEGEERKLANPIQQTIVINTLNMVQSESQEHASGEYGAGQSDEDEGDFDDEKIRPRF
ncbi:hypothetical protein Glove_410g88 [Diversispora epigaea]|uniref:Uncharacterized protein n=1 Tax=Diversispora epigaea TaxID=1348612 RepID=A0A397GXY2_9GLOM|nr:hypothetical protein Glove_410g88 [Diversispora epigaea]